MRFGFFGLLILCGCAFPPQQEGPEPAFERLEMQLYDLVNQYRRAQGLPRLHYNRHLADVARRHSQAMADGATAFGHDGYDDRVQMVRRQFRTLRALGENLARNNWDAPQSAYYVYLGWVASRSHRDTIEGMFEVTGVGVAQDSHGVFYYTQLYLAE